MKTYVTRVKFANLTKFKTPLKGTKFCKTLSHAQKIELKTVSRTHIDLILVNRLTLLMHRSALCSVMWREYG